MTSIATITANWYVRYREAVQLDESSIRRPEMPEARGGSGQYRSRDTAEELAEEFHAVNHSL
jgi:hypothetical protein